MNPKADDNQFRKGVFVYEDQTQSPRKASDNFDVGDIRKPSFDLQKSYIEEVILTQTRCFYEY